MTSPATAINKLLGVEPHKDDFVPVSDNVYIVPMTNGGRAVQVRPDDTYGLFDAYLVCIERGVLPAGTYAWASAAVSQKNAGE